LATVRKEDCECPRNKKATCRHRPWKVSYREPGGRAGRPREVGFKLQKDAEAFATKVERDKDLGVYIDPRGAKRLFSDVWKEWATAGELEESTRRNYASVYKNHFKEPFGSKPIGSITPSEITAWETAERARYKAYGVQVRFNVLSSVFNYAVEAEIIGRSPCKKANPRKNARKSSYTPVRPEEVPTLPEVLGIIAEAPKILRASYWSMAGSGLRPGEALAVAEDIIDWELDILTVCRQVTPFGLEDGMAGRRGWKRGTKHRSFAEARRSPIPTPLRRAYGGHIEVYGVWGEHGFLHESPRIPEQHPSYDYLLDSFKQAAKAAGTPQYTPKSFRHFFVSAAIHAGIPIFEIAQWVGHRTTKVTELVYAHILNEAFRRGRDILSGALGEVLQADLAAQRGKIIPIPLTPDEDEDAEAA
jgi:integrase